MIGVRIRRHKRSSRFVPPSPRHAAPRPLVQVPAELADRDYTLPRVQLPASRPLITAAEPLGALDGPMTSDAAPDDTQVLDMSTVLAGDVVDPAPRPAEAPGLEPVEPQVRRPSPKSAMPVPTLPFLNAGAPAPVAVHIGNALPAALSAPELMLLGRPVPDDAPAAVQQPVPVRRSARHPRSFGAFDTEFWAIVRGCMDTEHAEGWRLLAENDERDAALSERLARMDAAHCADVERIEGMPYAAWLACQLAEAAHEPLPHRTPGAAKARLESSWPAAGVTV